MTSQRKFSLWNRLPIGAASLFLITLLGVVPAAEEKVAASIAEERTSASPNPVGGATVKNPHLQKHLLDNVDVFGKSDLPAIYIFGPGDFSADQIDATAITRDFAGDPFLMQNIDREEFEGKMVLRGFSEEKEKEASLP